MKIIAVGTGYDSHRFVENRKLILGGVELDSELGLEGHSDADALCHAIIDAILGACGKQDIGNLFPDTDLKWKGVSSIGLLSNVLDIIKQDSSVKIHYIDAVIITEQPKIAPYSVKMKTNIATALNIRPEQVNLKAKTNEKMGFVGRSEGLAVIANVTIERIIGA